MNHAEIPFVSVVIPTRNRQELLKDAIESLFNQSYPKDRYEIIVIDNASTDGTDKMIHSIQSEAPCILKYDRKEDQGPGSARNLGITKARGRIIAFTDSDCFVDQNWIKNGTAKMTDGVGIVQGKTLPNPEQRQGTLSQTMKVLSEDTYYPTCNIFYWKESLDKVNGFSPEFCSLTYFGKPRWGGEDTDLAWKVKKEGWKSVFANDAVVYHHVFPVTSLRELFRAMHLGIIFILARNFKKHPELRESILYLNVFKSKQRALFYPFMLSLFFGLFMHWSFFLLGVPYVTQLLRICFYKRPIGSYHRGLALLVIVILQELMESMLSICASVIYRTVIL